MSFAQTTRSEPADDSPDAYLLSLAPQNSTARFLYNKTTGKKTVIEGVAATNQVLYVASPSTGDYTDPDVARWGTIGGLTGLTHKGDILTSDGAATTVLPVGTNGQALVANSAMPNGIEWATIGGGGAGVTSVGSSPIGGLDSGGSGLNFSVDPITTVGTISLADSGVTPGAYPTDASKQSMYITVDTAGRITDVAEQNIAPVTINTTANLTGGAALSPGDSTTLDLSNTAVTPGSYGTGAAVPSIQVDQKGRITGATNTAISAIAINTTTPILGGASVVPGGSISLTHANTAVTPGAYGSPGSALIPVITVDQKGHVTAASQGAIPSQAVAGDGTFITGGGAVLGVNPGITLTLGNSGVTAGSFGSSTAVPVLTVDAKGRITSATSVVISGASLGSITVNGSTYLTVTGSPVTLGGSITLTNIALDSYATRNWKAGTGSAITGGQTDSVVIGDSALGSGFSAVVGSKAGGGTMVQSAVFGYAAASNSPGGALTVMGYNAGKGFGASNSAFFGHSAGIVCTGVGNVFVGPGAGQTCTSGTGNTTIGNGADVGATVINAGAFGNGVVNTVSGTTLIGDGSGSATSHVVKSTGLFQAAAWYSCKAGRSSGTQVVTLPGPVTLTIASTVWTNGCAVSGNNITMPQANTQFSINACVKTSAIGSPALGTVNMRIRYYDGTTTSTIAEATVTTQASSGSVVAWCCSATVQTPNVTTAYVFVELERLTGTTASFDISNFAITVKRDA